MTGKDIFSTAIHSSTVRGQIWKTVDKISTCRMTKWSDIDRAMAESSQKLDHGGMTSIDWFSDRLFSAFNISMVTNTDKAIVIG